VIPGSSALFIMASRADPQTLVAALDPFGGAMVTSALTRDQEARLHEAVYGSIIAAAAS
jgi:uncharacterized membrane protein